MLRIALLGILLQLVLQTGIAQAICCDDIRSDIENRTTAFNVLCGKNDPHLGNCCRVIEQDLREHKLSYETLCHDHGNILQLLFYANIFAIVEKHAVTGSHEKFNYYQ